MTHLGEDGGLLTAGMLTQEQAVEIKVLDRQVGIGEMVVHEIRHAEPLGSWDVRVTVRRYLRGKAVPRMGRARRERQSWMSSNATYWSEWKRTAAVDSSGGAISLDPGVGLRRRAYPTEGISGVP